MKRKKRKFIEKDFEDIFCKPLKGLRYSVDYIVRDTPLDSIKDFYLAQRFFVHIITEARYLDIDIIPAIIVRRRKRAKP